MVHWKQQKELQQNHSALREFRMSFSQYLVDELKFGGNQRTNLT